MSFKTKFFLICTNNKTILSVCQNIYLPFWTVPLETERNGLTQTLSLIDNLLTTSGFAASRVQSEAYMDCRPPVLAPSALGNRPPVHNRDGERERETERERERERER